MPWGESCRGEGWGRLMVQEIEKCMCGTRLGQLLAFEAALVVAYVGVGWYRIM